MRGLLRLSTALLVLVGVLAAVVASPAVAKKHHHHKKPGGGTFTNVTPTAVGAATTTAPVTSGKATSTITVPKKKKALIQDVNVGVRLSPDSASFTTAGITLVLVAPSGQAQTLLFSFSTGGPGTAGTGLGNGPSNCSSGMMLFDDQAHKQNISSVPSGQPVNPYAPNPDPSFDEFTSFPPYAESVQPQSLLSAFNGTQAKGIWSLVVLNSNNPDTDTLQCWQLQITPQKPTKK